MPRHTQKQQIESVSRQGCSLVGGVGSPASDRKCVLRCQAQQILVQLQTILGGEVSSSEMKAVGKVGAPPSAIIWLTLRFACESRGFSQQIENSESHECTQRRPNNSLKGQHRQLSCVRAGVRNTEPSCGVTQADRAFLVHEPRPRVHLGPAARASDASGGEVVNSR